MQKVKLNCPRGDISVNATTKNQLNISSNEIPQRIVINANPKQPPHFLNIFLKALRKEGHCVSVNTYVHSSVKKMSNESLKDFLFESNINNGNNNLNVSLIWKDDQQTSLCVKPGMNIVGNSEICRFFARFLPKIFPYDLLSPKQSALLDSKLDILLAIEKSKSTNEMKVLAEKLMNGKNVWIFGNDLSIADILLWSFVQNSKNEFNEMKKWLKQCESHSLFR